MTLRYHGASMPHVLIRDLSAEVHARLTARAARAGQSLQQYLSAALTRLADEPTMDEVLARIAGRQGGRVGFQQAVQDLEAGRSEP